MGAFEDLVVAAVPSIEALIPADPAAELGRYTDRERRGFIPQSAPAQAALDDFPGLTAERLLGALELGVAELTLTAPAEIVSGLKPLPYGSSFSIAWADGESALRKSVSLVAAGHPGAIELITEQVRGLLPSLDLSDVTGDEATIISRHGAVHLALAVAVSAAVLNAISTRSADPVAIIGVAIGVTALLLPSVPKPPAYEQALLDKRRAEYRGRSWFTHVPVSGHEFVLVEEPSLTKADFGLTGLVGAIDTGFAVRTGIEEGTVPVSVNVRLDPPGEPDLESWDEIVEISYTAVEGDARFGHGATAPWPGEFRVRVSATGRDEGDERYDLRIWPAPFTEPLVHKKSDRLGHVLRGEPVPEMQIAPDAEFRWLEEALGEAGTVTIVTGLTAAEVEPEFDTDFVVVETEDAVVVVEHNNYVGSDDAVLERLSRNGKAASHYWGVNRDTLLSFARGGEMVAAEPTDDDADFGEDEEVVRAVDGFDWADWRHTDAKAITAVARFTGRTIPRDLVLAKLEELPSSQ